MQIYKSIILLVILTVIVILCYNWLLQMHFIILENETLSHIESLLETKEPIYTEAYVKVSEENLRRRSHVENMCQIFNINDTVVNIPKAMLDHLIVDDEHKLIYCAVPKVACTNWKRVLLALRNSNEHNPLLFSGNETHLPNLFKTLNQYSDEEIEDKLDNYLKFIFVRHPFERILSAFRNKFEYSYSNYFRIRYGIDIIKNFRRHPSEESVKKGHDVVFEEYLQYIVNLDTENHKIHFNEHWRPIVDLCFPCQIKYDIVGKYETIEIDSNYVLYEANLLNLVSFPSRKLTYKLKPTSAVMQNYYKNISKQLHEKLFKIYKEDFEFFEYKFDDMTKVKAI